MGNYSNCYREYVMKYMKVLTDTKLQVNCVGQP